MSHRLTSGNLTTGAHVLSDGSYGVLAESIKSAGQHGASYAHSSLSLPADNGKEIRGEIVLQPIIVSGIGAITSFFAYKDTSYDLVVTADCVVQWVYNLYIDGILIQEGNIATVFIGNYTKPENRKRKKHMNYIELRKELDSNIPLYGGLTDQQAADELNAADKVQNRATMSRQEILENIDSTALSTLTGDNATKVFGILSDTVDPFGNAAQVFIDAFGAGSQTITNLATARTETVTRVSQLGLGTVEVNDITIARNL